MLIHINPSHTEVIFDLFTAEDIPKRTTFGDNRKDKLETDFQLKLGASAPYFNTAAKPPESRGGQIFLNVGPLQINFMAQPLIHPHIPQWAR